ncbi:MULTISPECIES: DUF4747 family protein [Leptospira]|nr:MULTISPECIES: DUF4747 family protein [Leptospira]MDI7191485.1 DUF4747 family protein [Leptospira santarosai]MDI7215782.1 DUF4747 family protein [Leptospira santarosai]MDI7223061.1 DUF4747 family protein [Leptospira santarosai]MDI7226853.1 DUF4747 family protein [Leptospira santarosai]
MNKKITKKQKKEKNKKVEYYVLNIKYTGAEKGPYNYQALFLKVLNKAVPIEISSGIHLWFRLPQQQKFSEGTLISGRLSRFTKIEHENWLDTNQNKAIEMKLKKGVYPNHYETEYIFIPEAHRAIFKKNRSLTIKSIQKYAESLFEKIFPEENHFSISIEKSADYITEILEARSIFNLEFKITPSNLDIQEEASQFMDEELHKGNIGRIQGRMEGKGGGSINGKDSKLVNGILGAAKSNGQVSAKIEDSEGKIKKIKTEDYPRKFTLKYLESQDENLSILKQILSIFRGG